MSNPTCALGRCGGPGTGVGAPAAWRAHLAASTGPSTKFTAKMEAPVTALPAIRSVDRADSLSYHLPASAAFTKKRARTGFFQGKPGCKASSP